TRGFGCIDLTFVKPANYIDFKKLLNLRVHWHLGGWAENYILPAVQAKQWLGRMWL
ncbi:hypothetical protein NDU88_000145, partial [Pleurodeles waltl]